MWPFSKLRNRNYQKPEGIEDRVQRARDAVAPLHTEWDELWDHYDPEWQADTLRELVREMAPESDQIVNDTVVANNIYSLTETYVSTLMQAIGTWYVVSRDNRYDENARRVTRWLQAMYDELRIPETLEIVYRDAIVCGIGAAKVYWSEGTASAQVAPLSPYDFYPDPTAECMDDAEFVAIRTMMGEDRAKNTFPNFDTTKAGIAEIYNRHDLRSTYERLYEIWEVYWDFGQRYTVYTGGQVLIDDDSPVPNFRFPVHIFQMHRRSGQFWSESLIKYLTGIQWAMNVNRTRFAIHSHFAAYPIYGAHGAAPKDMVVSPGEVWRFPEVGSSVQAITPPPFASEAMAFMQMLSSDFDNVSGLHEVTRGIMPERVTSGVTVDILRQAAQTRLLNPIRNWSYRLADIGQQILEYHQAFSSTPVAAATVKSGEVVSNVVYPGDLSSPEVDQYGLPTGNIHPHPYRVLVQPPSDLPLSQAAIADMAVRMFQLGAIDQEALLEATNFPYREDVLRRKEMMLKAQEAGRMAALEQGAIPQEE